MVRTRQEGRKAAGLDVSDRISAWWASDDAELAAAIREHASMIAGEVLATSFSESASAESAPAAGAVDVQTDLPVVLRLAKA